MDSREKPDSIFKFHSFTEYAIRNLKSRQLFFSDPRSFNDPYDSLFNCVAAPAGDPALKEFTARVLEQGDLGAGAKSVMAENPEAASELMAEVVSEALKSASKQFGDIEVGVTCFSEDNENLLMWSHYADRHAGFCMEFSTSELPFSTAERVVYEDKFSVFAGMSLDDEEDNMFMRQIHTKAADWKYEKEWRMCLPASRAVAKYPPDCLLAIYFGARCKESDIQSVRMIAKDLDWDFKMFRGRLSNESFKIEFAELATSLKD